MLYKTTITRLITEDSSSRAERERDETLSKGHVVFEGTSAQILTYDREYIHPSVIFFIMKCFADNFSYQLSGSSSQAVKDEGRGSGQPGDIVGLKRPYDLMEGGISRGLPMRDSLSVANCEGTLPCCSEIHYGMSLWNSRSLPCLNFL